MEQLYNKLLDDADRFRLDMGDVTDNVSLQTALDCLWDDVDGKAGTQATLLPAVAEVLLVDQNQQAHSFRSSADTTAVQACELEYHCHLHCTVVF